MGHPVFRFFFIIFYESKQYQSINHWTLRKKNLTPVSAYQPIRNAGQRLSKCDVIKPGLSDCWFATFYDRGFNLGNSKQQG